MISVTRLETRFNFHSSNFCLCLNGTVYVKAKSELFFIRNCDHWYWPHAKAGKRSLPSIHLPWTRPDWVSPAYPGCFEAILATLWYWKVFDLIAIFARPEICDMQKWLSGRVSIPTHKICRSKCWVMRPNGKGNNPFLINRVSERVNDTNT